MYDEELDLWCTEWIETNNLGNETAIAVKSNVVDNTFDIGVHLDSDNDGRPEQKSKIYTVDSRNLIKVFRDIDGIEGMYRIVFPNYSGKRNKDISDITFALTNE